MPNISTNGIIIANGIKIPILSINNGTVITLDTLGNIVPTSLQVSSITGQDQAILDTIISITGNLQSQINNKANTSDLNNYTLLTTTSSLTGNLQSQINNILNNNIDINGIKTFTNDVIINGDLFVNGSQTIVNSTTVSTCDNVLFLNAGEPGAGVTNISAGLLVDRGSLTNYAIIFDELSDGFKIGEVNDLQMVATREDSPLNGGVAIWNHTEYRFDTTDKYDTNIQNITANYTLLSTTAGLTANLQSQINNAVLLTGDQTISGTKTFNSSTTTGPITITRQDTVNEGGNIALHRANDNTAYYNIDVYGSSNTPNLRIFNEGAIKFEMDASGIVYLIKNTGKVLQLGNYTGTSTSDPCQISLGGTYSDTAGANLKIKLFDNNDTSLNYGFGVSSSQLDIRAAGDADIAFWMATTEKFTMKNNGTFVSSNNITSVVNITGNYTITNFDSLIRANSTSASLDVTLPSSSLTNNQQHEIIKTDNSSNIVTIKGTINGVTDYPLTIQYETIRVSYNGSSWEIL